MICIDSPNMCCDLYKLSKLCLLTTVPNSSSSASAFLLVCYLCWPCASVRADCFVRCSVLHNAVLYYECYCVCCTVFLFVLSDSVVSKLLSGRSLHFSFTSFYTKHCVSVPSPYTSSPPYKLCSVYFSVKYSSRQSLVDITVCPRDRVCTLSCFVRT